MKVSPALYRAHCICLSPPIQKINLYLMLFFSYCFIGWIVETVYIAIVRGHFASRGLTSHGLPLIPLFGYAGIVIIRILMPLKKKPWLVFILAVALTTLTELATSFMNTYIFFRKTWDYSSIPLSLGGRIAVPVSLSWGILVMAVLYFVDPALKKSIVKLSPLPTMIFSWSLALYCLQCIIRDLANLL